MSSTAVIIVLITGCRPKEAAYIVFHRSIRTNDHYVKFMDHTYQAFAPASDTKTHSDYLWLLPKEFDRVADRVLALRDTGYATYDHLKKALKAFFVNGLLQLHFVLVLYTYYTNAKLTKAQGGCQSDTDVQLSAVPPSATTMASARNNSVQHAVDDSNLDHASRTTQMTV